MRSEFKNAAHQACRILLRPLTSMLLRAGMTWKEFADLAKTAFVETATAEYGISGRPTNISRVSILTGISRKEVKRQRDLLAAETTVTPQKTTDATRVLSGWFQDPDFLNDKGEPLPLVESGAKPSFEDLCRRYGGDIAAPTMLKELLTTATVATNDHGRLFPMRRYYQPARHDDENLLWAVNLIRDLSNTMNNNVFKTEETRLRFGGKADNTEIPASRREAFQAFMDQRGQAFLEEIDDWLTENASDTNDQYDPCVRLGVGVFAIEDQFMKETQS